MASVYCIITATDKVTEESSRRVEATNEFVTTQHQLVVAKQQPTATIGSDKSEVQQ